MTTYSTSLIQTFTDAFLANLQARAGLKNVLITDGPPPASYTQTGEIMWLGDVNGEQEWAALGNPNRPRNEEFTIDCYISCIGPALPNDPNAQTTLSKQCFTLMAEVEQCLRADPTQGIVPAGNQTGGWIRFAEVRSPLILTKRADDTARESALQFGVYVAARL